MKIRLVATVSAVVSAVMFAAAQEPAARQAPPLTAAATASTCTAVAPAPPPPGATPAVQGAARGQGRGGAQAQGERPPTVMAIAGVIAAGSPVTQVYSTFGANGDGVIALPDGSILINQEENNAVIRIDQDDRTSIYLADTGGSGALSRDRQGRIFAVVRMPTATSIGAARPNAPKSAGVSMLVPERKMIADTSLDGRKWTGRPNDLAADSRGGAFFTQDCVYYASPAGTIALAADNVRPNGIVLSLDDARLFVTHAASGGAVVLAFDVDAPGKLSNRRTFATLPGGAGDAMTIDTDGRLYVASAAGVQVFEADGKHLGVIPIPRGATGEAFGGPDRRSLYVVSNGVSDGNGQAIAGRTVYRVRMIAQGVAGRSK